MSGLINKAKLVWLRGVEVVGKTASNLASNATQKVAEINLETRRREILSEFNLRALELWRKGVALPQPLDDMLVELTNIDERLSVLRAQKYARVEHEPARDEQPQEYAPESEAPEGAAETENQPEHMPDAEPPEEAEAQE